MKKTILALGGIVVLALIFVGCTGKENMMFTQSGLDKIHIKELVITNDVTKKTFNIKDADGISKLESVLDSVDLKDAKEEGEHSGCNIPGQNKYYIEFLDENNNVVGDLIISKEGDIQINNFETKYIKEVKNVEASKSLEEVIEDNIQ